LLWWDGCVTLKLTVGGFRSLSILFVLIQISQVGPYANPQEAYEYYTLPYCAPDTKHHPEQADGTNKFNEYALQSIGEHLSGHALRHSGHDVTFDPVAKTESCKTPPLTADQATAFTRAIQHRWFYQMYLDDLPVWGMVGELLPASQNAAQLSVKEKDDLSRLEHVSDVSDIGNLVPYVYTTRNLIVRYNGDQIVQVDLTSDPATLQKVETGAVLDFRLHIRWEVTNDEFHSRFDRYLDHEFFKHPIHWFSVFNSFMMVLFLMGLVALILLRTLKKDYARYGFVGDMEDGGSERDLLLDDESSGGHGKSPGGGGSASKQHHSEDGGWKQVHGDVFRAPMLLPLFAALIGTGWQLVVLSVSVILFAVLGPLHGEVHEERGEMLHSVIVCYSLSSIVAGYTSGQFFKMYYPTTAAARRQGAEKTSLWQAVMALTVVLLPTVTVCIVFVLNTVSLLYGTINTIPFLVIVKLFLIWVCVSVPLTVVGTMIGRHGATAGRKTSGPLDHFPCRVNAIPRPIPEDVPWYGKPAGLIPLAGLLSFGSIFIELYYVLTSLWNYKFYHVYGFLLGVYSILTIVVSMTSIIVVYFCLNAENYLWQWTAFGSGASTAAYVFLYGIYYFLFKTQMHGLLQTVYYFGYMTLIALNMGLLCGTIGHGAASRFVRAIFQNVKVD
jgi:transmembrane 9 superfamily member 3